MFWGICGGGGLVTKLVHSAYSGVRPPAINTPIGTRIASCALLCGASLGNSLKVGEGDGLVMPLT